MKKQDQFEKLVARARSEAAPSVDVAGRVIAILAAEQDQLDRVTERPLMWLAAFSSTVAAAAAVFAIVVYNTWADPLMEIVDEISWVMQ